MAYYRTCEHCGANLDPGEKCDCTENKQERGRPYGKISRPQRRAYYIGFIEQSDRKKAATVCKVSEAQIYARLRNAAFKEKYDRARRELLAQSTAYLQGITGEALQKMYQIMNDPDAAPQTQLNAANSIASNSQKMTEQADILAQIAELKRAVFNE
jgi:hypothetical protein